VTFLKEQEEALAAGKVREEDCIQGSGRGDAPLFLYLVEDELDRMSLLMVRKYGLGWWVRTWLVKVDLRVLKSRNLADALSKG